MATLHGGAYDDHIKGTKGSDFISGLDGADHLNGDKGDDVLFGDAGDDRLNGGKGDDGLWGSEGNDDLMGGKGDDRLYGDAGDDVIRGDKGNDVIDGGLGSDTLWSGKGQDTFVFTGGGGQDVVMDFQQGQDILQIAKNINGLQVETADDLASRVTDVHGNAVVDLGNGDTITLQGVSAEDVQTNPNAFFVIG
jgi:Ca2+-binding RTX toxin-like protein